MTREYIEHIKGANMPPDEKTRTLDAKPVLRHCRVAGFHAGQSQPVICRPGGWIARLLLVWSTVFVLALAGTANQGTALAQSAIAKNLSGQIDSISRAASLVDRLAKAESVDDQTLANARVKLDGLGRDLQATKSAVTKRLAEINARLDQIAPPKSGDDLSQAPSVVEERKALGEEKAELAVLIGRTEETESSIASTTEQIAARRRAAFSAALFVRQPFGLSLFQQVFEAGRQETAALKSLVSGWLAFTLKTKPAEFGLSAMGALAVALGLFSVFRRLFSSLLYRNPAIESPAFFSKIVIGFWSAILPSLVFAVFLGVAYGLYSYFDIFTPKIAKIFAALFYVLAGIYFVYNLASAILVPNHPRWRLIAVHDSAALKLLVLAATIAGIYGVDAFLGNLNKIIAAPLALTVVKSLVASLLIGGLIVATAFIRAGISQTDGTAVRWPNWVAVPLFLVGISIIAAALAGYIGLASFFAQQIVVTGAILITMYIGILAGRQISSEGLLA